MRIVFLCEKKMYNHKMSRVRFDSIDAIKRFPGVWLKKTGHGWPGFVGCSRVDEAYKPDLVIVYKPLGMKNWNKIKTPTCLRYNEMWNANWTKHEIKTSDCRLVICHHLNDMERFNGKLDPKYKLVHNPHCAETQMYHDNWGLEKTVDVTLFGKATPGSCYPLRFKFAKKIGNLLKKKGVKFHVFHHPGYRMKNLEDIKHHMKKYAKAINRTKIAVTDASSFHYALAKYPEIPLCRTALCADLPRENQSWYRKWMIPISKDYNAEKIISIIMPYLKDEQKLKKLTELGYQENLKLRTQEEYARRFVFLAQEFLDGKMDDYDFQKDSDRYYNGGDGEHK